MRYSLVRDYPLLRLNVFSPFRLFHFVRSFVISVSHTHSLFLSSTHSFLSHSGVLFSWFFFISRFGITNIVSPFTLRCEAKLSTSRLFKSKLSHAYTTHQTHDVLSPLLLLPLSMLLLLLLPLPLPQPLLLPPLSPTMPNISTYYYIKSTIHLHFDCDAIPYYPFSSVQFG